MVIELTITPRKIERTVFILLVLFFLGTTIYYSYKAGNCSVSVEEKDEGKTATTTTQTQNKTTQTQQQTTPPAENKTTPAQQQTATTPAAPKPSPINGTAVEIEIGPLQYTKGGSGAWGDKASIAFVAFTVKNKGSIDVTLTAKIYAWDSSTSEDNKKHAKQTIPIPTVKSMNTLTKAFETPNLNFYNLELEKTINFVFLDESGAEVKTLTKTIKMT